MKVLRGIAIAAALVGAAGVAYSREMSTDVLEARGAMPVARSDLAALLGGANVLIEDDWKTRQMTLYVDGSFVGSQWKTPRRGKGKILHGTWRIDDDGRWCETTVSKGDESHHCWTVWKLGDKYYISGKKKGDLARELSIRK